MFEIPVIKIEAYERNRQQFAQELGQALETVGVAQVNGLEQQLVDELYQNAEGIFEAAKREDNARFRYDWTENIREHLILDSSFHGGFKRTIISQLFPAFKPVIDNIYSDLKTIYKKIIKALEMYVGEGKFTKEETNLCLFRLKNSTISTNIIDLAKQKNVMDTIVFLEDHEDSGYITLAPRSTRKGLEGFINGEWASIQPESGNVLVFPGMGLETKSKQKIKSLRHRVRMPPNFVVPRLSLTYSN